jgi:hypothetical protein
VIHPNLLFLYTLSEENPNFQTSHCDVLTWLGSLLCSCGSAAGIVSASPGIAGVAAE